MFHSAASIRRRTGADDLGRFEFLQQLVTEYEAFAAAGPAGSAEARERLARLANFAYDPINHGFLWDLNALDLFLDAMALAGDVHGLGGRDLLAQQFAAGGLCNFCLEPRVMRSLAQDDRLAVVLRCLEAESADTVLSALTILWFASQSGHLAAIAACEPLRAYLEALARTTTAAAPTSAATTTTTTTTTTSALTISPEQARVSKVARVCLQDWFLP